MIDQHRVQHCVESLCAGGCEAVRATIAALERGHGVAATDHLGESERAAVLTELRAVMAVYDARPPVARGILGRRG